MNRDRKRLVLFVVLSFLPLMIVVPILNLLLGERVYVSDRTEVISLLGMVGMMMPAAAHVLTRILTGEGFSELYLFPKFEKNARYYLAAVLVPLAYSFVEVLLVWKLLVPQFGAADIFSNKNGGAIILFYVAMSVFVSFPAFGEEWGWRGYMMPKLRKCFKKPTAILVGGIIWGLWHAPLTVAGHNFGVDYWGYPFTGIATMCVWCCIFNLFLTVLTERTGSIYPATIAHMTIDYVNTGTWFGIFSTEEVWNAINSLDSLTLFWILLPGVVGVIAVGMWLLGGTKNFNCLCDKENL